MRILIVFLCALFVAPAFADTKPSKPVPSGPLKAYKGPEGERVVMVEVNDSKQMLVYFDKIGGGIDGKSYLYQFEDHGKGSKDVFLNKKRGSKWYQSFVLTAHDNQWHFYHPTKAGTDFDITYSEKDSDAMKVDDVLAAYKP
jgi:hypothetical protein